MRILSWLVVNVVALAAAVWLVGGITVTGATQSDRVLTVVLVGVILGVITSFVKPVVTFFAFPLILVTLGIFLLVINALLLMLTGAVAGSVDLAFDVDGFGSALLGSIVISVVSWLVGAVLPETARR
ncbi:phage holin family protein [Marmoricola endophyticus]|uniref:phage holin family protein n=1 Tax=Marmoricola endophyticus TaxID=2040280 RepID=UPI00166EEF68|nr:phage holin family protein [Marmoricola endophyticus]